MRIKFNKQKFYDTIENPWFIISVLTALALLLRLWNIGEPTQYIYDETYYVKYAKNLIAGEHFIDVHPPGGESVIAFGIYIFGTTWAGVRILPALMGTALIPISYLLALRFFKNQTTTLLTAFFVAFDCLILIQSRAALLTMPLTFFIALGTLLYIIYNQEKKWRYLIFSSLAMGVALSIQWLAAPVWGTLIVHFTVTRLARLLRGDFSRSREGGNLHSSEAKDVSASRRIARIKQLKWLLLGLAIMLIVPVLIYLLCFLPVDHEGKTLWQYIVYWHKRSFEFHWDLRAPHKYGSRWYLWPVIYQPVLYYQAYSTDGIVRNIIAFGNPLLWWSAIITYLIAFFGLITHRRWSYPLLLPMLLLSVYYFGWIFIDRPQFFYYLLPVLIFYFMILAYFVEKLLKRFFVAASVWLILAALMFIYFYPTLVAYPVPKQYFESQLWLPEWRNVLITYPR